MVHLNFKDYRYGKCSKISNTFLFLFSNKTLVIRAEIQKMFVRKANKEDFDQIASEAVWVFTVSLRLFGRQLVFKIL